MYFYFSSATPAGVKLNDKLLGIIDGDVIGCELDISKRTLAEICPLTGIGGIFFAIDKDVFVKTDPRFCVTDLGGGYLINVNDVTEKNQFKIYAQEKFGDCSVTVFCDNGNKISVETANDFYAETLNLPIENCKIKRAYSGNENLLLLDIFCGKRILIIYRVSNKIKKLFFKEVADYDVSYGIKTEEKLKDMAKHKIVCEWELKGDCFTEKSVSVTCSEKFDRLSLPPHLIPFAFAEELAAGGDYVFYLSDSMKEHADKLKGFLGDFIGVMPPPKFRNPDEIGLIYKISDDRFKVTYITAELNGEKITNIKKSS